MQAEVEADPDFQPRALLEQPDLWPHLQFASDAFSDLSSDRLIGAIGGCGPIPWSAIDRYAERYGIDNLDEFERFRRFIRGQDRVYLERAAEEAKGKG
ncbi:phage tail assembly chaperone [Methylobacterium sp. Leaf399]|uniref:phage tail assembly chaperone n=1 Tax=Methylobacterium sp. Leaf399 TaxID=1736364 RepID=UPI003FCE24C9